MDDFLIRAVLAALGVAIAAGPLGCFIVWRRMAYFGDATAHAALMGVALSLTFDLPPTLGVLAIAMIMAVGMSMAHGRGLASDTLLGVAAHSALALGLVVMSYLNNQSIDIMAYLFGDVLAVNAREVGLIWLGAVLILILLFWRWKPLLLSTLNPELALTAGIKPQREALIFTLTLAVLIALSIKVVGVLLITALLIIPAAAARALSRTPDQMALLAVLIGAISAVGGLMMSLFQDTPAGPSIVVIAATCFVLTALLRRILAR